MSTNPFASALEGHKSEQRVDPQAYPSAPDIQQPSHHPNNPFVHATSSSPPQSPNSNPFQAQAQQPYHIPQSQSQSFVAPISTAPTSESADAITQSLSGLDFGSQEVAPASSLRQEQYLPQQQQSFAPSSPPSTNPFSGSEAAVGPGVSSMAAATRYAPPPGPPPGMAPISTLGAGTALPDISSANAAPIDQSAAAQVSQMESDEAYARQLWAKEEERRQRREDRHRQRSQGGSQRNIAPSQLPDPELAAVGGAPGPRHRDSPAPLLNGTSAASAPVAAPRDPNEEKSWNTKEVYWRGRSQRIVIQNENGPCSLIALCNVLLLRNTIQLTPADRPAASYSYLSSLIGEHLIDIISANPDGAMDLEAALSILPQTQHGLDVNVRFSAIDGFALDRETSSTNDLINFGDVAAAGSSSAGAASSKARQDKEQQQRGELALFKLCNVPLVHGWLADQADTETWAAVVERSGDYDRALDRVVAGDDLAKGMIVNETGAGAGGSSGGAVSQYQLDALSPTDKLVVNDALLIRRFLESTATQLTYPGLYALSTTLHRGQLYTLFRNSHLSVLYRPSEEELLQASEAGSETLDQPQLYQLVTDSTLENEDAIVWESIEDVDGSASRFFDGKFRPARVNDDFAGRQHSGQADEDADFAYAQHLQDQEHRRAEHHRQTAANYRRRHPQGRQDIQTGGAGSGSNNIISRMLANRKAGKRAPSSNVLQQNVAGTMGGQPASSQDAYDHTQQQGSNRRQDGMVPGVGSGPGEEIQQPSSEKKWWKKVF